MKTRKTKTFSKIIILALTLSLILASLAACKSSVRDATESNALISLNTKKINASALASTEGSALDSQAVSASRTSSPIRLGTDKGWTVKRGNGWLFTDDTRLIYWNSSQYDTTYDWAALKNSTVTEGTITANVSAKGNVGIFFGGSGLDNLHDSGGTGGVSRADGVKFGLVSLLVASNGTATLQFYYDYNDVEFWAGDKVINVALNDTTENTAKYGLDGTDIEIKVQFTAAGKVTAYVNGVKAIETGANEYPTFGTQHGVIVRSAAYPRYQEAGYVKSYYVSTTETLQNKGWTAKRGNGWLFTDDTRLIYWNSTQYDTTYDWAALKNSTVTEGTITANVSAKGNVGIFFGGSGLDNLHDSGGTGGVSRADGVKFGLVSLLVASNGTATLQFYYDYNDIELWAGDKIINVPLNDTTENTAKYGLDGTDIEIKVQFTAAGKVTAYVNGVKAIETGANEYPTFGTQHGVIVRSAAYPRYQEAGYVKSYDTISVETLSNGATVEFSSPVNVLSTGNGNAILGTVTNTHYPSIIELQHQPNKQDNGKLIAHFSLGASNINTSACFMESTDGGKTWNFLSLPTEQNATNIADGLVPGSMAHLYELPAQVGNFPAGTLVYSSGSINYSKRSEIWIWYSTDCGKTWTQTSKVASGGSAQAVPGWAAQTGVWEPFTWYEDGWLYCFYSDDSDPAHDQKLVYKRSQDGINWSDIVDVCKFSDPAARPGMFVMTKMGNGEFFMVYEYIGAPGGSKIYYKKTTDITSWNSSDPGNVLMSGSSYYGGTAPSCLWIPSGGECGTLIATTCWDTDGSHRIFVSFDYGQTWSTMTNPLPYTLNTDVNAGMGATTRIGYSPSFALGADGKTVYYLNTTDIPGSGYRRIQFASFVIY